MDNLLLVRLFLLRVKKSLVSRYKTFCTRQRARFKALRARYVSLGPPKSVIWIFGCQRSGTTFLERIFRHDLDSVVFGEFSELTIAEGKTVLSEPHRIRAIVESKNARYAVIRPLFESDRAPELLELFPNSVGVWLFRDWPHVVDSMIRKWGDTFFDISKRVESDTRGVWRLEGQIKAIQQDVRCRNMPDPLAEVYALYWLMRNQIPFRTGLINHPKVIFLSYEQLVLAPRVHVDRIMKKAGLGGVWKGFRADAFTSSLYRPVNIEVSEETRMKCDKVYQELIELSG